MRCLWCSNPESQNPDSQLMVFSNLCTGCGQCVPVCPQHAVRLLPDGRSSTDRKLCVNCGRCAAVCPAGSREISGKPMDVAEVLRIIAKDELFYQNSGGGVTFGGGEPTTAGAYLLELMHACRKRGYHICLDTCGHCEPEMFATVMRNADLLLFDCKHMDREAHKRLTGVDNRLILENLRAALECGVLLRLRIPLMPGLNDTPENIAALAAFIKPYGLAEVDVLPCHTFGHSKYKALDLPLPDQFPYTPEDLKRVSEAFLLHGLRPVIVA